MIDPKAWVAISQAIADHVWLIDNKLADRAIDLFAENPRLEFAQGSPVPAVYEGRQAVDAFLQARAAMRDIASRHVVSNIRMMCEDDGSIRVTSCVMLFRAGAGETGTNAALIADVTERYVLEADGIWRIGERIVAPVFKASAK
ncbi:nuclear transport factor 2 family protein [Cupriavidus alkaliphilus]|uniref:nuclear transport factor 2 family protein n=1 Tax=Cupriavidus alkaliphilus TaxID=942866 RepID=UPI001428A8E1|nr:nuclear transport factor 2 family protein [Cupriavidus alkaliphilus]